MSNIRVFEERNIQKAVLTLGLPAMLGQLATLIYNMADTYFVSLTDDPAQIAAVTLCTPILLIIMSIACIFGMGGSSVIARMLGEKNMRDAKACVTFCAYAMAAAGILVLAAGLPLMRSIAGLAGADTENIAYTCDYLRWIFLGAPFIILANGFVHIFRSTGLIKEATVGLVLGNGVNIIFDWLFIVCLRMGTAGAAAATSFGFFCATVYYLACVLRASADRELFSLSLKGLHVSKALTGEVLKIGFPGALITVMLSVSNIVLNNYIGLYGSNAVAAYGIAYKVNLFPIMLSVGLSQGVAPLIGYCYGAKQEDRLTRVMRTSALDGILLGAVFTVVFLAFGSTFTAFFLRDSILIEQSAMFLRIMCLSAPMLGIINMVTAYYQALGEASRSLLVTLLRNVVLFIPGVILLNSIA
jgi:putative MATE family efflux protein